jgi:penicillin-binding protein 1A
MAEPQHLIHMKAVLQKKRASRYLFIVQWLWRFFYSGVAVLLLIFISINFFAIPSFRELENPSTARASEVLANDRSVLGRYFVENRVPLSYEQLNPHLVNALIATEDSRFRKHAGIDGRAILRVVVRTILMRDERAGGGSTLTQQLAKMLYSDRDFEGMGRIRKTLGLIYRKLREWITAVKLEKSYTKEEIIALYLNQVDFINNAVGIHSASEVYFGKDQSRLSIPEAATLVGMLQNPAYFNPNRYPERCIRRRWVVLYQMRKAGIISEADFDKFKLSKFDMSKFRKVSFTDDKAPYMCDAIERDVKSILQSPECRKPDGTPYNLYRDGIKIYTSIDPTYQAHAEAAMEEQMKKNQKRFFEVWKGRDPWTHKGRNTTDQEIKERKRALWRSVREGDRFQGLWPIYMDEIVRKIKDDYGHSLSDNDMERMLEEEATEGSLNKMLAARFITSDQATTYRSILRSSEWKEIRKRYLALTALVKKQYNTKVKMKVFSWNGIRQERDTLLTPLDSLRYHRMFLQTGILAVDPKTSHVKAWVGGINFKYFQFDHIRSERQVGSTFKPFVYATAISQLGISPCQGFYDIETTIPGHYEQFTHLADWTPSNSTGEYTGIKYSMKEALKNSINTISAQLMRLMGSTAPVRGLVNNMGIDSSATRSNGSMRVPREVSICLGAADLTVFEMTGAYSTFANGGRYGRPIVILKIEDKNGKEIWKSLPEEKVALSPNFNYVMVDMLRYNVSGAPGLNTLKSEVGGKTGTTNDYSDGWFMGITPGLTVGVWVGGEDRWIRFLSLADGQGARMARPIFAGFISRLEKDNRSSYDPNARFNRPEGELGIEINCEVYRNMDTPGADGDQPQSDDPEY